MFRQRLAARQPRRREVVEARVPPFVVRFGRKWVFDMAVSVPLSAVELAEEFDVDALGATVARMLGLEPRVVRVDVVDVKHEASAPQLAGPPQDVSSLGSSSVPVDGRVPGALQAVLWSQWDRRTKPTSQWRDKPRPARTYLLTVSRCAVLAALHPTDTSVEDLLGDDSSYPRTQATDSSSALATVQR